jgi:hypothetical protein
MTEILHYLLRFLHKWEPVGLMRTYWVDGFEFWTESHECYCGARTWRITDAAVAAQIKEGRL